MKFSLTKLEKLGVLTAIRFAFDLLRKTIYIMRGGHRAGVFLMMHFRGHIDYKPLMRGIFGHLQRKFVFHLSFASCSERLLRLFLVKSCLSKINAEVSIIRNPVLLIKRGSGGEEGVLERLSTQTSHRGLGGAARDILMCFRYSSALNASRN